MFTVVAVILIEVPITVLETLVPTVVVPVVFRAVALGVLIPTPLNADIVLTSPIVATYPDCSKVEVAPK